MTVHVTQGGGSFGRHLFSDAAFEAAAVSQKIGKPVKLMWHRTDNFRQGRVHPMCTSRVQDRLLGEQRARLRPAAYECRNRLHPRVRRDPDRPACGRADRRPRLCRDDLHADPERALQLRPRHTAAERDLRIRRVQHLERAEHLQPGRDHRDRADGRPGREGDGTGSVQVPPLVHPRQPADPGARQGRAGGQLGPRDAGRNRSGTRRPRRVQGRDRGTGRDRLHAGDRQPPRGERLHRPAGDEDRRRGRHRACRSTRSGFRPR